MIKRDNRSYYTVAEYCKIHKVSKQSVHDKIKRWTIDTVYLQKAYVSTKEKEPYIYDWVEYSSLSKLAEAVNINYQTLYHRIKRWLTIEQAINTKYL